jgi:hypothetical protein
LALSVAAVVLAVRAEAQSLNPGPPGPFVIDVRGVTSGVPHSEALFPELPAGASVPTRGFGIGVGAHVYAIRLGPARFGLGVDAMWARGSTPDASSRLFTADPQISINFGTSDGWSYLSAGAGVASVNANPGAISDKVSTINWGGGARWFLGPHLGVGFDIRIRTFKAGDFTPKGTSVAIGAGVSMK